MAIQSLAEFTANFGSEPVEVELPQFAKDGASFSVYLRPMSSKDRDAFEASVVGDDGKTRNLKNLRARLVCRSLCDENGKLIASEDELGELPAPLIGALFDEAQKLNGMSSDDIDEAGKD